MLSSFLHLAYFNQSYYEINFNLLLHKIGVCFVSKLHVSLIYRYFTVSCHCTESENGSRKTISYLHPWSAYDIPQTPLHSPENP